MEKYQWQWETHGNWKSSMLKCYFLGKSFINGGFSSNITIIKEPWALKRAAPKSCYPFKDEIVSTQKFTVLIFVFCPVSLACLPVVSSFPHLPGVVSIPLEVREGLWFVFNPWKRLWTATGRSNQDNGSRIFALQKRNVLWIETCSLNIVNIPVVSCPKIVKSNGEQHVLNRGNRIPYFLRQTGLVNSLFDPLCMFVHTKSWYTETTRSMALVQAINHVFLSDFINLIIENMMNSVMLKYVYPEIQDSRLGKKGDPIFWLKRIKVSFLHCFS